MKIIGLTGGIGSGKSTVLEMFNELGAVTYIADIEAKKLMVTNKELIQQIKNLFGNEAYLNGELNRAFIASVVFKNKEKLVELNNLVHPKVREHFQNFVKTVSAPFVIYEAAILFESGSHKMCDYIITVTANLDDRIQRVMQRDGVTKEQVLDRMKNQLNDDYKIKNSNFIVENNNLKHTKQQVLTIYNLIGELCKE